MKMYMDVPEKKAITKTLMISAMCPIFLLAATSGLGIRLKHETPIEHDECESIVAIPIHEPIDRSFA